eukprot:GHVP01031709.1.p1 GENE.GHVP01031709.1~~GHVP01031709.1.p1  ORF type:complete len:422 (+),score=70.07 GHVP01031709.1:33-1268(+)
MAKCFGLLCLGALQVFCDSLETEVFDLRKNLESTHGILFDANKISENQYDSLLVHIANSISKTNEILEDVLELDPHLSGNIFDEDFVKKRKELAKSLHIKFTDLKQSIGPLEDAIKEFEETSFSGEDVIMPGMLSQLSNSIRKFPWVDTEKIKGDFRNEGLLSRHQEFALNVFIPILERVVQIQHEYKDARKSEYLWRNSLMNGSVQKWLSQRLAIGEEFNQKREVLFKSYNVTMKELENQREGHATLQATSFELLEFKHKILPMIEELSKAIHEVDRDLKYAAIKSLRLKKQENKRNDSLAKSLKKNILHLDHMISETESQLHRCFENFLETSNVQCSADESIFEIFGNAIQLENLVKRTTTDPIILSEIEELKMRLQNVDHENRDLKSLNRINLNTEAFHHQVSSLKTF